MSITDRGEDASMPPPRVLLAILTTILVSVVTSACTSGGTNGETDPTPGVSVEPVEPAADPTVEELLAAAVVAVEALEIEYPDLFLAVNDRYDSFDSGDQRQELYEQHDFVEGTWIAAVNDASDEVLLHIDVFASHSQADGFRADFAEQYHFNDEVWSYVGDPVEVPGWPRTAHFQTQLGSQQISYIFVHGPAAVWLRLRAVEFDSPEAAGVELANALDLVQASLNETVPIPN